jgi:glycosyltransferase involved in cell wall biosynthesis
MDRAAKRVVLLGYYFPPSPAVGGLRTEKLARAFQRAGHDVLVLTSRLPGEKGSVRLKEPGLEVRGIRALPNPRFWYLAVKNLLRGRRSHGGGARGSQDSVAVPRSVPGWKRLLGSLMWLPDDKQGFILAGAMTAFRHGRFDLIYTTAPPFSVHLAALILKAITRTPWAAEFRDPWTDNPWKPAHVRTRISEATERWLENRVLKSADYLVAVSEGIHKSLVEKLPPQKAGRCLLIRNGIAEIKTLAPVRDPGPFRIVHIGSFYHDRDPRLFLKALASVVMSCGLGPDQLKLQLVGNCRWFAGISVEREVEQLRLTDLVEFTDWVPHAEAQAIIARADLLLLLAQNQPLQVPNKLYEYLGTRIPILAFADGDGESAAILRETGGHYLVTSPDSEQAAEFLIQAVTRMNQARGGAVSPMLEQMTVQRQMDKLISAVCPAKR